MTTPEVSNAMTVAPTRSGRDSYAMCGARTRAGGTCRRPAGWGTPHAGTAHCKLHCGSTPNGITSAALQATDAEARALLERLGAPEPIAHPVDELLALAAETREWHRVLRELLAQHRRLSTTDVTGVERERAAVKLYGESLDRCARLLGDLAKLGLEERRTRITELEGMFILAALEATLVRLKLDAPTRARAREYLSVELAGGAKALPVADSTPSHLRPDPARLIPHQEGDR